MSPGFNSDQFEQGSAMIPGGVEPLTGPDVEMRVPRQRHFSKLNRMRPLLAEQEFEQ